MASSQELLPVSSSATPGCESINSPVACASSSSNDSLSDSSSEIVIVPEPVRRRARGKPEYEVCELMTKRCCDRKQITCFKLLSQADIDKIRQEFYSLSTEVDQTQFLLTYMRNHRKSDNSILYSVAGHVVCETCFRIAYGIRYNRFATVKKKLLSGVVLAEHGLLGIRRSSCAQIRLISWLRTFFHKVGDKLPMCDEIHLPSCLTKGDVYALAVDDLTQGGLECSKMSTFYEVWKSEFPNVKIPKESRFSKCDVCTAIKEGRERTLDTDVRKWLGEIMEKHIQLERKEREKYAKHRQKAEKYPDKYLSVIIDGMDQDKTDIPHIISKPKAMAGAYTLDTHVTGVIAHGRCTMMAIDCGDFAHDSNLTIEIIVRLLHKYKDALPPVIYIQMDNTCRDNKNKYTLTFAALLVQLGIFRKVKLGFLPVGHTHEDIDQRFSCISRKLNHRNALTIPDLMDVIQSSLTPPPIVYVVDAVIDTKAWMSEKTPALHDHLKAHQFKFERNRLGEAQMYYKEWSTDSFWLPTGGLSVLPANDPIPTIQPQVLQPFFDEDGLSKLTATIRKIEGYLDKKDAAPWWRTWLEHANKQTTHVQAQTLTGTWMVYELRAEYCHGVQEIPAQEDTDDMSGVEVDSPYKFLLESQEFPCDIQGIGEIRTSWVGQQGVLEIKRTVSERKTAQEVKTLSSDIKKLASNCYRAFEKAGLLNSEDEIIKGAVQLCQTHIQKLPKEDRKKTSAIASLWKQHTSTEAAHCSTDLEKHATAVLGDKLVDTLTEKHREPPDIYIGPSRGRVHENRNVLKELKVGMLVAVSGSDDSKLPKVGKVHSIAVTRHTTLESSLVIEWLVQEKAKHKPKWLRPFKPSSKDSFGTIKYSDILLYDFQLTNAGCLKKNSREYLQQYFA